MKLNENERRIVLAALETYAIEQRKRCHNISLSEIQITSHRNDARYAEELADRIRVE